MSRNRRRFVRVFLRLPAQQTLTVVTRMAIRMILWLSLFVLLFRKYLWNFGVFGEQKLIDEDKNGVGSRFY